MIQWRKIEVTQKRFDGRVAVVTGAGGGLGFEHAKLLAARGAQVIVNDIGGSVSGDGTDEGAAQRAVAAIRARGGEAIADTHSVSSPDGAAALVSAAVSSFGRLDIVVNNAGILRDRSLTKMTTDDLDAVLDVHVKGSFYVTQAAFAPMREQGYGRIVNTTSPAGLYGNFGQANYSAAKAGLVGLTRTTAIEGSRYGILANAVSPSAHTRMTQDLVGHLFDGASAEVLGAAKVSPVVAWLGHEDCPVTGEVFGAAGGLVTRIFIAETVGIFDAELTIETLSERVDELLDREGYRVPADVQESMAPLLSHLAQ